jgi:hypothetical protein
MQFSVTYIHQLKEVKQLNRDGVFQHVYIYLTHFILSNAVQTWNLGTDSYAHLVSIVCSRTKDIS